MPRLASLLVDLKLESASLRKGLDEANRRLKKFELDTKGIFSGIKNISQGFSLALARDAVKAMGGFVLKGAETADAMGKMATAAGVGVESFSRLAYAFELSDVSSDELGRAFKTLNKNLTEAGTGSRDQVALFRALDVAVTDSAGKVRAADAVMADLADRFAAMEEGPSKAALAMQVFGDKIGPKLTVAMKDGAAGLKALGDEGARFGVVITEEAFAAAEKFNDNLTRLRKASEGVAISVAADVAPAFTKLIDEMLTSEKSAESMKEATEALAAAMRLLASTAAVTVTAFNVIGKTLAALASYMADFAEGGWVGLAKSFKGTSAALGKELVADLKTAMGRLDTIWEDHPKAVAAASDKTQQKAKEMADKVARELERQKKAIAEASSAWKSLEDILADLQTRKANVGKGPLDQFIERMMDGDISKHLDKIGSAASEMAGKIQAAFREALEAEQAFAKQQLDFEAKLAGIRIDRDTGKRKAEFSDVFRSPQEQQERKFDRATSGFGDFFDALDEAAKQTKLQIKLENDAKLLEGNASADVVRAKKEEAFAAGEAADAANVAATAFEGAAAQLAQAAAEAAAAMKAKLDHAFGDAGRGIQYGLQGLFATMGESGQIANSALAGFQSAGIWGAIIAVILELLSRFERFGEVMDKSQESVNKALEDLAGGLGELVDGLLALMDALQPLKDLIHGILNPILSIIGTVFKVLAEIIGTFIAFIEPILSSIGDLLGGISDILKPIGGIFKALGTVLKPLFSLFGTLAKVLMPLAPIFFIIGKVLSVVSLIILGIFWVIGKILNSIQDIFDPNAKDWVDTGSIERQIDDVTTSFADGMDEGGEKIADAADRVAKRLDRSGKPLAPNTGQVATGNTPAGEGEPLTSQVNASTFTSEGTGGVTVLPELPVVAGGPVAKTLDEFAESFYQMNPGTGPEQLELAYKQYVEGLASDVMLTRDAVGAITGKTGAELDAAFQAYLETIPGYVKPALQDLGDAAKNTADSLERVNEAFHNAPSGYKLALARFNAEAGVGVAADSRDMRGVEMRGVTMNFVIQGEDPEAIWDTVKRRIERESFNLTGSSEAGFPQPAPGF